MKKYHWLSEKTGEVVPNILGVVKVICQDLKHCHFINLKWKYSRKGF